jgi:hypothetical protein
MEQSSKTLYVGLDVHKDSNIDMKAATRPRNCQDIKARPQATKC